MKVKIYINDELVKFRDLKKYHLKSEIIKDILAKKQAQLNNE